MRFFGFLCLIYLLGSLPNAWLVVKLTTGRDLLEIGTGNSGTRNTYRATQSYFWTGLVLLLDLLKGFLTYLITYVSLSFWSEFIPLEDSLGLDIGLALCYLLTGLAVIIGHNRSLFLGFRGGKGIATGAGFLLLLSPVAVVLWSLLWLAGNKVFKIRVLPQILASGLLPLFLLLYYFWLGGFWSNLLELLVVTSLASLVFLSHFGRIWKIFLGMEDLSH